MTTKITPETTHVMFWLDGHEAISIASDGTIVYHNNYTPDEAAKLFWEAVEQYHPYKDEIYELRNVLAMLGVPDSGNTQEPDDPIEAYDRAMKILGRP